MTKKKKIILIISAIVLALIGILLVCMFCFKHRHKLVMVEAVQETCVKDGNVEYYVCDGCGKIFLDSEAVEEVTEEDILTLALGHEIEEHEAINPTFTKEGKKQYWSCSRCGKCFIDAACTVEAREIDLILAVLDGDGIAADGSESGEFNTKLLKTGILQVLENIEGATSVFIAGNSKLTKVYRDGAEISFTVDSSDDKTYQVLSVSYNGETLQQVNGVYKIIYNAEYPRVTIEVKRDQSDTTVTLPAIPAK